MTDDQIRLVETSGTTQPRTTVRAPIGGVVVELMAREGMALAPGVTLFRISGLSTWQISPGAHRRGRITTSQ